MKPVEYRPRALKTLSKMPRNTAVRIRAKIDAYAQDPASQANNVKALKGTQGAIQLRVGDWRVIMEDGVVLVVMRIGPRGGVYE